MKTQQPQKGKVSLPHGAWLDRETASVFVPVAGQTLNFAVEEIEEFASIMDDIATVISSNAKISLHVCQACGTEIEEFEYQEPEGEDLQ